jgi:hypothetical protein
MRHFDHCDDRLAMPPVTAIVAAAIMATAIAAAIVDAEHTIYASNHAADTRANRAADNAADRSCRAITPVNALIRAAFHSAKNSLRMRRDR